MAKVRSTEPNQVAENKEMEETVWEIGMPRNLKRRSNYK